MAGEETKSTGLEGGRLEQKNRLAALQGLFSKDVPDPGYRPGGDSTGDDIQEAFRDLLANEAVIVNPRAGSFRVTFSEDKQNAASRKATLAELINGAIGEQKGLDRGKNLVKPVVITLNHGGYGSGTHWAVAVILPPNKNASSEEEEHKKAGPTIHYVDSYYENADTDVELTSFFEFLTTSTDLPFQGATVETHTPPQQADGRTCGWWAVYNAYMIVKNGGVDYLDRFNKGWFGRYGKYDRIVRAALSDELKVMPPSEYSKGSQLGFALGMVFFALGIAALLLNFQSLWLAAAVLLFVGVIVMYGNYGENVSGAKPVEVLPMIVAEGGGAVSSAATHASLLVLNRGAVGRAPFETSAATGNGLEAPPQIKGSPRQ